MMAFVPFVESDQPTMAAFNERFFQLLDAAGKTEIVSYVGTGTYGPDHKSSLTFSFVPKLVVIIPVEGNYAVRNQDTLIKFFCAVNGMTQQVGYYRLDNTSNSPKCNLEWDGTTFSWYVVTTGYATEAHQMNTSGETYFAVAIG